MPGSSVSSRKPLWIIMAGFSVVLVANAALVYFALGSWTGLETEQPYVKGLAYNSNIEGAKRQQALGWQAEMGIEFLPGQSLAGATQIRFSDKSGLPLSDLDVRIFVTRPTNVGFDQERALAGLGDGLYRAEFTLPLKGQWDFRIVAQRGAEHYQRVERIVTP